MSHSIEDRQDIDVVANDEQRRQLRRELQHFRNGLYRESQTLRQHLHHFRCELKQQVIELRLAFRQNHKQTSQRLRIDTQQYIYHVSKCTQSLRRRLRYPQLTDTPIDAEYAEVKDIDADVADKPNAVIAEKGNDNVMSVADIAEPDDPVIKKSATLTDDIWTALLKEQVEHLLKQAVNIELEAFIAYYRDHRDDNDRQAVVRNGYLPERTIETALGTLTVRIPKTRDRSGQGIKFNSQLLPPYLKQTQLKRLPLAWWCWHGMAVGNFYPLLQNLLDIENIGNGDVLSQATRERLEALWRQTYLNQSDRNWSSLHLSHLQATVVWQDAEQQQGPCCLVVIAIDDQNRQQVLTVGSERSADLTEWKALLISLREQGLRIPTSAVLSKSIGPGAFQEALHDVFSRDL